MDPGQVSRWINNKNLPRVETLSEIGRLLAIDLSEAFQRSLPAPEHDLFVSAPISGLSDAEIDAHRKGVANVVAAAKQVVDKVYWSGEEVASFRDLRAPDLATLASLKVLASCSAYLYLQFAQMVNPSGALVQLGIALGRKLKTTVIIKRDLRTPYMFEGFQFVAGNLDFLPETHIYVVDDVDDAVHLIEVNGRQLLL